MSEALTSEWENRVKEVEKELSLVESEIAAVQAQRKGMKGKIRNYWSEVEKEKKELLEQFNKLEAEIESLRSKCEATVKEKDEVYAVYMATLDEYENMHYLVREIRDQEVSLTEREDLEAVLQKESQEWSEEEHKLRSQLRICQQRLKEQRKAHAAQIAQLQERLVDLEVKQRQAQAEHDLSRQQRAKEQLQGQKSRRSIKRNKSNADESNYNNNNNNNTTITAPETNVSKTTASELQRKTDTHASSTSLANPAHNNSNDNNVRNNILDRNNVSINNNNNTQHKVNNKGKSVPTSMTETETQFVQQHLPQQIKLVTKANSLTNMERQHNVNNNKSNNEMKQQQQQEEEEEEYEESFYQDDQKSNNINNNKVLAATATAAESNTCKLKSCLKNTSLKPANANNLNANSDYSKMCRSAPVSRGNSQTIVSPNYNIFSNNNNNNNNKEYMDSNEDVDNTTTATTNFDKHTNEFQQHQQKLHTYNAGRAVSYTSGKALTKKRVFLSDATNEIE